MASRFKAFLKSCRDNYYLSTLLANSAKPVYSVSQSIALQVQRRIRKNGVTIPLPNGKKMTIGRDTGIGMASLLFWHGLDGYEAATSRTLRFFFERAATFIDVGANCGVYSVLGPLWNPNLQVVAFEPVPAIFEGLKRNIRLNRLENCVHCENAALSSQSGSATLFLPVPESRDLESTGTMVTESWQARKNSARLDVQTVRLTARADQLGPLDEGQLPRDFTVATPPATIFPRHPRNDQVGALHLRSPLRSLRSHARRLRPSHRPSTSLDRHRHGRRPLRRHGLQSLGRRRHRRRQSPHSHPRHSRRPSLARIRHHLCRRFRRHLHSRRRPAESAHPLALAGRPRRAASLLLHQALHPLVAPRARLRSRHRPSAAWIAVRGSLDPRILLLTAAVTFWVAGFDVLYACQDFDSTAPPASTPSLATSASPALSGSPAPFI
jgi:FkbM family methyltransferase